MSRFISFKDSTSIVELLNKILYKDSIIGISKLLTFAILYISLIVFNFRGGAQFEI